MNLAGTLSSSGVIIFANSLQATPQVLHTVFGNREKEHSIMRYPAFFLVGGVGCLFVGFMCGITLYYGLGTSFMIILVVAGLFLFFECYWSRGHSDSYNAVNLALGALFFRSCMPDMGSAADTHEHLNLPPLPASVYKRDEEEGGEEGGKSEKSPSKA